MVIARRQFLQAAFSASAAMTLSTVASPLPLTEPTTISPQLSDRLVVSAEDHLETNRGITVVGVGGGGCSAVENMMKHEIAGIESLCVDTDPRALLASQANRTIQLGTPDLERSTIELGRAPAEAAAQEIRDAIQGARTLVIIAGMGGGTEIGALPVIARIASAMGIITIGVVTTPFAFEGIRRFKVMNMALTELKMSVDHLIVFPNENLLDMLNIDCTLNDAFALADDVITSVVEGIAEIVARPKVSNLDFSELRAVVGAKYSTVIETV
jgi:cell division protein FtsZ